MGKLWQGITVASGLVLVAFFSVGIGMIAIGQGENDLPDWATVTLFATCGIWVVGIIGVMVTEK